MSIIIATVVVTILYALYIAKVVVTSEETKAHVGTTQEKWFAVTAPMVILLGLTWIMLKSDLSMVASCLMLMIWIIMSVVELITLWVVRTDSQVTAARTDEIVKILLAQEIQVYHLNNFIRKKYPRSGYKPKKDLRKIAKWYAKNFNLASIASFANNAAEYQEKSIAATQTTVSLEFSDQP